jgi:carbon storage regulator
MLVLTRKLGERVLIGDDILVTILDVRGDGIRVGIEAPRGIRIQRDEVVQAVARSNVEASAADDDAEAAIKASLDRLPAARAAHGDEEQPTD